MDDAVLKARFNAYDELIDGLKKKNEELENKVQKLECKAGFARTAELERIEKERADALAEKGMTPQDLLDSAKVAKPSLEEVESAFETAKEQLEEAVANGKLTDEQRDKLLEEITKNRDNILEHISEAPAEEKKEEEVEEDDAGGWFDNKKEKAWFE